MSAPVAGGEKDLPFWQRGLRKGNFSTYDASSGKGPHFLHFNHGHLSRMDFIFLSLLKGNAQNIHFASMLTQGPHWGHQQSSREIKYRA